MTHSTVRFQVCLCAALLATVLELVGVRAAAVYGAPTATTTLSAQTQFVRIGNGAAFR
jgi:hypothetical protein